MQHIFFAYGEGHFASTATGIFFGLLTTVVFCILFIVYAASNYPADQK